MRRARTALWLGAVIASAGWAVLAQPAGNQTGGESGGAQTPPEEATPPPATTNATVKPSEEDEDEGPTNAAPAKQVAPRPPPAPLPPPKPVRAPTAVLQALDKVTTETIRFVAPVGQPVRFKTLVFTVKACETTGLGGAAPQSSAYVVIDSAPQGPPGAAPPPARRVFKGWMYASSPELDPFQHPIYDAWLVSCAAAMPPS